MSNTAECFLLISFSVHLIPISIYTQQENKSLESGDLSEATRYMKDRLINTLVSDARCSSYITVS